MSKYVERFIEKLREESDLEQILKEVVRTEIKNSEYMNRLVREIQDEMIDEGEL